MITMTHTHSRYDSSGRGIGSSQRPLPGNTQHSQQTDIQAPSVIRTRNPNKRAAADLHPRPRGNRGRLTQSYLQILFCVPIGQISTPLWSKLKTKPKNCLKYGLAQSVLQPDYGLGNCETIVQLPAGKRDFYVLPKRPVTH
jgi:hypothetical protein